MRRKKTALVGGLLVILFESSDVAAFRAKERPQFGEGPDLGRTLYKRHCSAAKLARRRRHAIFVWHAIRP